MDGPVASGARARATEILRCPECGSGDLFLIEVARREGGVWRGAYCAGRYDHERHRFLARSCGYAGGRTDGPAEPEDSRIDRVTG